MIPSLEYQRFSKLEDALKFLRENPGSRVIAGGTDLVVQLRAGKIKVKQLVDIQPIKELSFIREEADRLSIGALTTIEELKSSDAVRRFASPLWEAVQNFATWQVRNVGTIGGNLCNASPAADTATPLIVLDARVKLRSLDGERVIPVKEFFTGPGETVAKPDEILSEVIIPRRENRWGYGFEKLGRRVSHILSIVNAAAALNLRDGRIEEIRVALGSVAPIPVRAKSVENRLRGREAREEDVKEASEKVVEDIKPISDVRASAEYRVEMSKVLTRRVIMKALKEVRGG